jgi:hypothetical protein
MVSDMPGRTRSPETQKRDQELYGLRIMGATFQQLGDKYGITQKAARDGYLKAVRERENTDVDEVRGDELERLDHVTRTMAGIMSRRHFVTSQTGKIVTDDQGVPLVDDGPVISAAALLLRTGESRRKMLGVDKPTQHEVQNVDVIRVRLLELGRNVGVVDGPATRVVRGSVEPGGDGVLPPGASAVLSGSASPRAGAGGGVEADSPPGADPA